MNKMEQSMTYRGVNESPESVQIKGLEAENATLKENLTVLTQAAIKVQAYIQARRDLTTVPTDGLWIWIPNSACDLLAGAMNKLAEETHNGGAGISNGGGTTS